MKPTNMLVETCKELNIPIIAYSPLCRGFLGRLAEARGRVSQCKIAPKEGLSANTVHGFTINVGESGVQASRGVYGNRRHASGEWNFSIHGTE